MSRTLTKREWLINSQTPSRACQPDSAREGSGSGLDLSLLLKVNAIPLQCVSKTWLWNSSQIISTCHFFLIGGGLRRVHSVIHLLVVFAWISWSIISPGTLSLLFSEDSSFIVVGSYVINFIMPMAITIAPTPWGNYMICQALETVPSIHWSLASSCLVYNELSVK